ncbi:MAG: Phytoene synthase [Chlorobi bacterium]|nr:Phytoene synthase [Chlorobiota bacterium]
MSTTENVREAYEYCRNVTLKYAKTFYFASIFLPKPKRNACYAVYAFCRYIDDLIDENVTAGGGRADREAIDMTIARWRNDLDAVYAGRKIATPVMLAWGDTLRRFNIRRSLPDELIEGVMTDLRQSVRFDTFGQLHDYCYKVASVVGLMTSEIFGYSDPVALRHAVDLGIAMQLTNILRDVSEDFGNDRIYIPNEEMARFGLDDGAIGARRVCENFRRMMAFQIERAHAYYDSADIGIAMLEGDSRLTVTLMSHNYRRILGVIERNGYDVFSSRASVPLHRKLMTIPVLWYVTR